MDEAEIIRAPRWRRTLAGLADSAIAGGVTLGVRGASSDTRALRILGGLLAPGSELLREQLGSPGQRLLGVRTVDARTGRRVELWRTLVLLGVGAGGQVLARRLAPPAVTPEQERSRREVVEGMWEIKQRHPADTPERRAAERELLARHPSRLGSDIARATLPTFAVSLLHRRLRRRLAPTTEVSDTAGR